MLKTRVIPCLLLQNAGLVKTIQFKNPTYLGDPINTVKIFNEKEVDELLFLDISATEEKKRPNFGLIEQIASECFMPLGYGGGIRNFEDAKLMFSLGVEKIVLNTFAHEDPTIIRKLSETFGSQSVVVSMDVKKSLLGKHEVFTARGKKNTHKQPAEWAKAVKSQGAGEIFVNSIDRDGTYKGYDLPLIKSVAASVNIPVVACGGAGSLAHFGEAVKEAGAAAVAAGSFFVFHGPHRAVLINFPTQKDLQQTLG